MYKPNFHSISQYLVLLEMTIYILQRPSATTREIQIVRHISVVSFEEDFDFALADKLKREAHGPTLIFVWHVLRCGIVVFIHRGCDCHVESIVFSPSRGPGPMFTKWFAHCE